MLKSKAVQNLKKRYPIIPRAFHGNGYHTLLLEPIGEP
jgi:hypothetical protein